MKKILVFGGTGYVGSIVVRKALERGYKVIVATRGGVPEPGTPLATLAQRVPVLGGRMAAMEMAGIPAAEATRRVHGVRDSLRQSGSPSTSSAAADEAQAEELVEWARSIDNEKALEFVSLDASSRPQVFHFLHDHPDTTAIVSTVGLLTRDYDAARKINGDVNTNIAAGACHPKLLPNLRKLVYVSAEPFNQYWPNTIGRLIGHRRTLKGYFHGKRIAEKAVLENLGARGAVLRPGFIYGTRYVSTPSVTERGGSAMAIPLWWVGWPLDKLLTAVHGYNLLTPPVDVEVVAETALRTCEWAALPERDVSDIVDTYRMKAICALPDPTLEAGYTPATATTARTPSPSADTKC